MEELDPTRDRGGRFAKGNPGGPGRPRGSGNALRRAAEEAVTPDHVSAIIRRATRMALEGDLVATRIVLKRVCGRPHEAPAQGFEIDLDLPNLRHGGELLTTRHRPAARRDLPWFVVRATATRRRSCST